ncbi:MAG: transporter [Gemmatimonadota bacterium]|nr:transporter [Gemmatimonadota bacterium]
MFNQYTRAARSGWRAPANRPQIHDDRAGDRSELEQVMIDRQLQMLLLAVACTAAPLQGQQDADPPIATGRPSFASGAGTVPSLQVETGYQFTDQGTADEHAVGQLTVRLPVLSTIEVRASLGSYMVQSVPGSTTTGFEDLSLGTKIRFITPDPSRPLFPSVALIAATSLPTGSEPLGSERLQPSANLIVAWELGNGTQLLSNTVVRSRYAGAERFGEVAQGVHLGLDLPGAFGSYVGVYGTKPAGRRASRSAGFGLTYAVHRDLQLDLNGGVGLNAVAADHYIGIGIGWRR